MILFCLRNGDALGRMLESLKDAVKKFWSNEIILADGCKKEA